LLHRLILIDLFHEIEPHRQSAKPLQGRPQLRWVELFEGLPAPLWAKRTSRELMAQVVNQL